MKEESVVTERVVKEKAAFVSAILGIEAVLESALRTTRLLPNLPGSSTYEKMSAKWRFPFSRLGFYLPLK